METKLTDKEMKEQILGYTGNQTPVTTYDVKTKGAARAFAEISTYTPSGYTAFCILNEIAEDDFQALKQRSRNIGL